MSKHALLIVLLVLAAFSVLPASAQEQTLHAADYVPADFAGFIQIRLDNPRENLRDLNLAALAAAQVQPGRVTIGTTTTTLSYENFIPFSTLFEVEGISFTDSILPWVQDEAVIAYRDFDGQLQAGASDILLVLPTNNLLNAAGRLSTIIKQEGLLTPQPYRGIEVYEGDDNAIALTTPAVFIGPTDLVHAALDVQAGVTESITANPIYTALRAASDENPAIFAYVGGDHILAAVSGLVGGQADSQALMAAFGGALAQIHDNQDFETRLLTGDFDGAAASLSAVLSDTEIIFTAKAVFHSVSEPEAVTEADFDSTLLDMIPRNAVLVQSGSDAKGMVYDVIAALPMTNFARQMIGGLPFQTLGTESEMIPVPESGQIAASVETYINALATFGDLDLQKDLLDHLSGSYVMAALPRPNNPVPVIQTPFDIVIAAHVDDESVVDSVSTLLQNLFDLQPLDDATNDDWTFTRLGSGSDIVFNIGVKDGLLLITTGDTTERILDAQRGENRLIDQTAWETLSENTRPDLYIDVAAFLNTFFPSAGGLVPSPDTRTQLALHSAYLDNGIYTLQLSNLIPLSS